MSTREESIWGGGQPQVRRAFSSRAAERTWLFDAAHQESQLFLHPIGLRSRLRRARWSRRVGPLANLNGCVPPLAGAESDAGEPQSSRDQEITEMNVLITGAAGYIGTMLTERLAQFDTIDAIYGVDISAQPAQCAQNDKLFWIRADVAKGEWVSLLDGKPIDVVIHCAYQIRQLYGRRKKQQEIWNIDGARKVFEFALACPHVRRVVHLSTVSAYGALPGNSTDRLFTEDSPLSEDVYLYGVQKKRVENLLGNLFRRLRPPVHVVVLRLASVSGPRGRFGLNRYGLLSTIAGRFPFLVCGRPDWGRQYLHEDDLIDVLSTFIQLPPATGYEVFNVSPPDFLDAASIGRLFNKRVVPLPPLLLRALFWLLWHGSRGAVTTPAGAWKFLSYPIRVDGWRLQQIHGYEYRYSSGQALTAREGSYADTSEARLAAPLESVEAS
jgi:UDP-glucose 4-epimerase